MNIFYFALIVITVFAVVLLAVIILIRLLFLKPSNQRNWSKDQAVLPYATREGDQVTIHNIRNFKYHSAKDYTPNHYTKTFNLNDISSVSFVLVPFFGIKAAHPFLSFGFGEEDFLAISIEIRKKEGEGFSPFDGACNRYELMYVMADERDVMTLRAVQRKNSVYLYPTKTTPKRARELFVDMIERANTLKDNPEFYNTFTNTCFTNMVDHVNNVSQKQMPWDIRIFLPRNSDKMAQELGFIDDSLNIEEARKQHLITSKIQKYANDPDFSIKIRQKDES